MHKLKQKFRVLSSKPLLTQRCQTTPTLFRLWEGKKKVLINKKKTLPIMMKCPVQNPRTELRSPLISTSIGLTSEIVGELSISLFNINFNQIQHILQFESLTCFLFYSYITGFLAHPFTSFQVFVK